VSGHFGTKELDTSALRRITKIALLAYNCQSRREGGEGGQAPPAAFSRGRHFEEDKKFSACVRSFKCFTAPGATDPRAATDPASTIGLYPELYVGVCEGCRLIEMFLFLFCVFLCTLNAQLVY